MSKAFQITPPLWLLLGLFAGALAAFLMLPTALVIPMSFSSSDLLEFPPRNWSLRWWRELPQATSWLDSIQLSLRLALATTVLAVPIALGAAYAATVMTARQAIALHATMLAPLLVPPILTATGLFFVYAKVALNGTFFGLLLGHTLMAVPVAYLLLRPALARFDFQQEHASRSLGATRWRFAWSILLPQIAASLAAAAFLAFLSSLDEVIISIFVGAGNNTPITKFMFESLRDRVDPMTAVVSTAWTALVLALVIAVQTMTSRRENGDRTNRRPLTRVL